MMYSKFKKILLVSCLFIGIATSLQSQTIAEKKAGIVEGVSELGPEMQKFLIEINRQLRERKAELAHLQDQVLELYEQEAPPESYQELLLQINEAKGNIRILQESWREMATKPGLQDEGYALWHQPDTTIEQLVIDYGSMDFVYLLSPEIAETRVSISSNIPIPHAAWGEMLEHILLQNGIGIKELNPFLRQLFMVNDDLSNLRLITADPLDLEVYPNNARVSFVLSPEPMDVQRIWHFLEKFYNPNSTVLQRIGRVILVVGEVSAIKDLLKIYDFVTANKRELEYRAIPLYRVDAEEMAKILTAIFEEFVEEAQVEVATADEKGDKLKKRAPPRKSKSGETNALNVIALPKIAHAVFLIGTREEIDKAVDIIDEVEGQVGQARDRSIFWHNVKHSDPEELAQVMEKLYLMMIENRVGYVKEEAEEKQAKIETGEEVRRATREIEQLRDELRYSRESQPRYFQPSYYQQGGYAVNPRPVGAEPTEKREFNKGRENFIVDPKTGALVMVVETDLIPKLKDVIKKLDVPKKMVQIEVLLFERIIDRSNSYGLNILNLGDAATQTHKSAATWNGGLVDCPNFGERLFDENPLATASRLCSRGIFDFFFSRKKTSSGFPAFDLAYKFIMTQDDVYLNASPSVVTLNQTEASITINDERSILVGRTLPETTANVGAVDNFTRSQYGITIKVTPTINMADEEDFYADPTNYVTLVSQINFDTFDPSTADSDQPIVNRREIINEVRIPDGQSVIIGGLRRKEGNDSSERVPFLGEIPGLGKLFSTTSLKDRDTEMIIFMTPKIISEPTEDFAKLRLEHLCKRPGDLPAFLCKLNEALNREKYRLFQGYMTMLLGRQRPRYICEEGEYDGR